MNDLFGRTVSRLQSAQMDMTKKDRGQNRQVHYDACALAMADRYLHPLQGDQAVVSPYKQRQLERH